VHCSLPVTFLPPSPTQQAVPGGKIEWKKGELIGKGSFGKVYMAMNSATGELIAVKQVRLNTAEEQEQAAAIQNEIGLMENLRHPNIVSLLGTQRNGNKLNILMEYVPGKASPKFMPHVAGQPRGVSWDARPVGPPPSDPPLTRLCLLCLSFSFLFISLFPSLSSRSLWTLFWRSSAASARK